MITSLIFQPVLPWAFLAALGLLALVAIVFAIWRRLPGWWLRALAVMVLLVALAGPKLKQEEREPLTDVVFLVVDQTSSQSIEPRPDQIAEAVEALKAQMGTEASLDLIEVIVRDGRGAEADRGTLLATALAKAAAEQAQDRIAGAIVVSDGRIEDADILPGFPAPVHLLMTGTPDEWDRRLVVETAPAFGILGEAVSLEVRVEALGNEPGGLPERLPLALSVDGDEPTVFDVPTGQSVTVELELDHGGRNLVQLSVPPADGELTDRNNTAIVAINGVRDRLRVLLVSGEPHAGERTWRNLLKSDPAVDLVHFTILRPPHKQDGVPVYELSLIAFPTRELFMDKIDDFDLIIFDRYKRRGVLPSLYMENIVRYVREGGALLVASGPDFAGAESLYRTPLADVLPLAPTAEVIEEGYVPMVSELGQKHPITEGLAEFAPRPEVDGVPGWGRWFRLIDTVPMSETVQTVMEGPDARPLLVVDRPGEGRIAALASDHAWLWSRGFEGGGPQLELLRRLAHWLMKEPELEEEVLTGHADGQEVIVTRRSMAEVVGDVVVTGPDGSEEVLPLTEVAPGRFEAAFAAGTNGLFRLREGSTEGVVAVGPAAPREYENPLATGDVLGPLVAATGGGIHRVAAGTPDIRMVSEGRAATGRGWIGLTRREAYNVLDIRLVALAPGWLMLLLAAGLSVLAWRVEGR